MTLADVIARLQSDPGLSPVRRRDLVSAVRRVAAWLGRDPAAIAARLAELRPALARLRPVQLGVTPHTFQTVRSNVLAALRQAGATGPGSRVVLAPAWDDLHRRLPDARLRNGLSRFVHYCSANGIEPGEVDDAVIGRFAGWLETDTFAAHQRQIHRETCVLWNVATESVAGWPAARLAEPSFRKPRATLRPEDLPPAFRADLEAHLRWLAGEDPFHPNPPPRPCRPRTIGLRRDHFLLATTALVRAGTAVEGLQSLGDLVTPAAVTTILRAYAERVNGHLQARSTAFALAQTLVYVARHWVRATDEQLAELRQIRGRLGPQRIRMTAKNRALLDNLDDDATKARLLALPGKLLDLAAGKGGLRRAVAVQVAIAIELLLCIPLRMGSLIALQVGKTLVRPGGARGPWFVRFDESEPKNVVDLDYEVPPELGAMIDAYLADDRPLLTGEPAGWLFVCEGGRRKATATLSQQIGEAIEEHVGIHMTPHQFRHFAAKISLDRHPENYEAVRQLLGNKNLNIVAKHYAGIRTRQAGQYHDQLLRAERERLASKAPGQRGHRRRPRGPRSGA